MSAASACAANADLAAAQLQESLAKLLEEMQYELYFPLTPPAATEGDQPPGTVLPTPALETATAVELLF